MSAVVLAAGRGRRMGHRPKAGLLLDGRTYLEHVVTACREGGCSHVIAVVSCIAPEIEVLARGLGCTTAMNPDPDAEMFASVQCGLRASRRAWTDAGVVVFPVDHPTVRGATVQRICDELTGKGAKAWVRPRHAGRAGHPIGLGVGLIAALCAAPAEHTLARALRDANAEPHDVPVDDPGVLDNRNEPAPG